MPELDPQTDDATSEAGDETAPLSLLDRAVDAALELAMDRPWSDITLRDIARVAGVPFAELYARAESKDDLLDHLGRRLDRVALETGESDTESDVHDRLFETVMARLEAMAPDRAALIAIGRTREAMMRIALRLPRTARALLEGSGVDTTGARGALRIAGMTRVWARVLQVWRDDEGALNRTMAEIDKQLRGLNSRLGRVGAGF